MSPQAIAFIQNDAVHFAFKYGFLTILVLFVLFLIVALRQIRALNTIVTQPDLFPLLQGFCLLLILGTLSLFAIALVIL